MIAPNDSPKQGGLPQAMASTRRLAAILAADVAGYSRLMGADEEGTHERLKAHRRQLVDPKIAEHHGRIVKTTGDGLLVEFASVVDSVRCAAEVQRGMIDREPMIGDERRIRFRTRDLRFLDGTRSRPRQAALPVRGYGRAEPQEPRTARAHLRATPRSRRRFAGIERAFHHAGLPDCQSAAPVNRGTALRQYEQRPGAGVLCRWDHRGPDDRSVTDRRHARDLTKYCIHIPEQAD
jgi:hypothetical protein